MGVECCSSDAGSEAERSANNWKMKSQASDT